MMSSLEFLNFEMNELEGPIPQSMGNLENLKVSRLMLVYYTLVSSEFQLATYLHSASQSITMSKNFFDAVLPSELGKLMNLNKLIATDNLLSGKSLALEMMSSISLISLLTCAADIVEIGQIPNEITSLKNLYQVNLDNNCESMI